MKINKVRRVDIKGPPASVGMAVQIRERLKRELGGSAIIRGLGIHAATVQGIVYDFTDGGSIGVNIHPVTSAKMAHDALCSYIQGGAAQFRKATGLDMVDF
jgi:hypothetical protein